MVKTGRGVIRVESPCSLAVLNICKLVIREKEKNNNLATNQYHIKGFSPGPPIEKVPQTIYFNILTKIQNSGIKFRIDTLTKKVSGDNDDLRKICMKVQMRPTIFKRA